MPATPLIRVLLPAPLSPTRAVTRPSRTSRSTPLRTSTAPKLFLMPRRLRIGVPRSPRGASVWVAVISRNLPGRRGWVDEDDVVRVPAPRRPRGRQTQIRSADSCRSTHGGVLTGADVGCLLVALVDDLLHAVLVDRLGRGQRGLDVLAELRVRNGLAGELVGAGLVALDDVDRQLRGQVGLEVGVLVDGHALGAGEDPLQALDRGVLTGDRDLAREVVRREPGDDAAGHGVVGRHDAVDLAVVLGVQTVERVGRLLVVPLTGDVTDELVVARVDLRLEGLFVALLEQRGVVVRGRTVDVDDVGLVLVRVGQALLQARAHQVADHDVVEGDVVRGSAAEGEPVVVDARDAGCRRLLEAGRAGVGVEVDDHEDLDALVDHRVTDGAELGGVAACVLDVGPDARVVERLLQARPVVALPSGRGRRVGQDHADLAGAALAAPSRGLVVVVAAAARRGREENHRGNRGERGHSRAPCTDHAVQPPGEFARVTTVTRYVVDHNITG